MRPQEHTAVCLATIVLGEEEYLVTYEISGQCWYDPGKISGPPEDCYPEDWGGEVGKVTLIDVSNGEGEIEPDEAVTKEILEKLHDLDLDSFLYESWSGAYTGPDDGPDE